jgi:DNA replication protein DnaC
MSSHAATTMTTDLASRLLKVGLQAIARSLDDFLARATKTRLSPVAILEEVARLEEIDKGRRSQESRLRRGRIGRFKPMADFDWHWPKKIDRAAVDELTSLEFLAEPANVVLIGPNSTGKTTIAKNLAHLAVLGGYTARFTTASAMLNDLVAQDSAAALNRRLRHYCRPALLVCDELGYLSYDARYADLLFEVVTRRYQQRATIITTNKPFSEWNQVFPNAASVVTIIDRLVHKAEIITIEGDSYCLKEAKERAAQKARNRKQRNPK